MPLDPPWNLLQVSQWIGLKIQILNSYIWKSRIGPMEQISGKHCNQIFSGALYLVQKDQWHLVTSVVWLGCHPVKTNLQSLEDVWKLLIIAFENILRTDQLIGEGARDALLTFNDFHLQKGLWLQVWVSLQTFSAFAPQQSRARSKTCLCLYSVPKFYILMYIKISSDSKIQYISSDSTFVQLTLSKEPGTWCLTLKKVSDFVL